MFNLFASPENNYNQQHSYILLNIKRKYIQKIKKMLDFEYTLEIKLQINKLLSTEHRSFKQ